MLLWRHSSGWLCHGSSQCSAPPTPLSHCSQYHSCLCFAQTTQGHYSKLVCQGDWQHPTLWVPGQGGSAFVSSFINVLQTDCNSGVALVSLSQPLLQHHIAWGDELLCCSRIFLLYLFPNTVLRGSPNSCCSFLGNSHPTQHPCVPRAGSMTTFLSLPAPHNACPDLLEE